MKIKKIFIVIILLIIILTIIVFAIDNDVKINLSNGNYDLNYKLSIGNDSAIGLIFIKYNLGVYGNTDTISTQAYFSHADFGKVSSEWYGVSGKFKYREDAVISPYNINDIVYLRSIDTTLYGFYMENAVMTRHISVIIDEGETAVKETTID